MNQMTCDEPSGLVIEEVAAYLRKTGWQVEDHPNKRITLFSRTVADADRAITIFLPASNEFRDTERCLMEAVNTLAMVEDRPPAFVVQSIRSIDRDVFRQQVVGQYGEPGSLSLELAVKLVQNLRNLVWYSAEVEQNPQPYFAKTTKPSKQYVEQCRFGHTFGGSFGFTVEVPMVPSTQHALDMPAVALPFERRVVERMMRGLASVQRGVVTGDVGVLIKNFREGFNANVFEVLLDMLGGMEGLELNTPFHGHPNGGCRMTWPISGACGLAEGPISTWKLRPRNCDRPTNPLNLRSVVGSSNFGRKP